MCFSVVVDIHDLGSFTACEGLGVEVVLEQREEGGNNEFVHQLPVRMKYPNVKLTRALNGESALVAQWFASMAGQPRADQRPHHRTDRRPRGDHRQVGLCTA